LVYFLYFFILNITCRFVCFPIADYSKGDTALVLTANSISFRVDHVARTVFTTTKGNIQIDEIVTHAHELANAGVFAYAQLIDARESQLKISPGDVNKLVFLIKELRKTHGTAKTAFVTRNPADFGMMRMYELQIGDDDPGFSAFYDINQGIEWILS
jgi:hypothetical protein